MSMIKGRYKIKFQEGKTQSKLLKFLLGLPKTQANTHFTQFSLPEPQAGQVKT